MVVVACGWALVSAWGAIAAGHPSYWVFYAAALGIAVASIYRSVRRASRRRLALSIFAAVGLFLLAAAAYWLRPFPADPIALEALDGTDRYNVTTTLTSISMEPVSDRSPVGLIFQPGARVDARAYSAMLAELVQQGHPVVIVKQPLGIGFLALGAVGGVIEDNPDTIWVAAGHSLGGVAASEATDDGIAGLVLWASFPAGDISDQTGLDVSSIFGTADAIAVPGDIEESRDRLPSQTIFVPVNGAIHSFFGDYGLQPGDGTPTIERDKAQAEIVGATSDLLKSVERAGPS